MQQPCAWMVHAILAVATLEGFEYVALAMQQKPSKDLDVFWRLSIEGHFAVAVVEAKLASPLQAVTGFEIRQAFLS